MIGDITTSDDPRLQAWRAAVYGRGNTPTIMPSGAYRGNLAERIDAAKLVQAGIQPSAIGSVRAGIFWYVPAPPTVREIYRKQGATLDFQKSVGGTVNRLHAIPGDTIRQAGTLAKEGVSAITGIPTWAFPVLLIAGGAFVLYSVVPNVSRR